MGLGTILGRTWAAVFGGIRVDGAHADPAVQIWVVRRMLPRWAAGQAWGNIILIREDCWRWPASRGLVEHEYCHVLQWRRYGSAFLLLYIAASVSALVRHGLRGAYIMNRFEREARGEVDLGTRRRMG